MLADALAQPTVVFVGASNTDMPVVRHRKFPMNGKGTVHELSVGIVHRWGFEDRARVTFCGRLVHDRGFVWCAAAVPLTCLACIGWRSKHAPR